MRNTLKVARYRQAVVNKMLQSAGVSVGSTSGARGAAGVDKSVDGLNGGVVGLAVRHSLLTVPPDASPAAGAPALPARGVPAAPKTAAAAAVSALAARAVTGAAERPGQRASVTGRKAQASKEQAAKAVLVRKLRTTRDLADSNEGSTTDSTEAGRDCTVYCGCESILVDSRSNGFFFPTRQGFFSHPLCSPRPLHQFSTLLSGVVEACVSAPPGNTQNRRRLRLQQRARRHNRTTLRHQTIPPPITTRGFGIMIRIKHRSESSSFLPAATS